MKKYFYIICLLLLTGVFLNSCVDNFMETDKGNAELKLTSSASDLVLLEKDHSSTGLELSWTTGTNYGTGNKLDYTLEASLDGTNYSNPVVLYNGTNKYSWSTSVDALNQLLVTGLGVAYDTEVTMAVRLTAKVMGYEDKVQVSETSIKIKTYKPVTSTLYIIGDATPTGWSVDNPSELVKSDVGVFTWTGRLKANGGFKFITTRGNFVPSYNRNENDATGKGLIMRNTFDDPDATFSVPEDGVYDLKIDLLNMTISIQTSTANTERFDMVYFVGSFTNWSFAEMTKDVLRSNLWHYGAVLNWNGGGEFKFGTVKDWKEMLYATAPSSPYTSTGVVYDGADNKWFLPKADCGKAYKIALDLTKGSEKMIMKPFIPYPGLYLVGSATPNGWDLGKATAMTAVNAYELSWTGKLLEGEMKISCDKKNDWMGAWFMPTSKNKAPTGTEEQMLFIDKSDDGLKALYPGLGINDIDMKWVISQEGNYTITVNQLTEKISILKH